MSVRNEHKEKATRDEFQPTHERTGSRSQAGLQDDHDPEDIAQKQTTGDLKRQK